MKILVTGGAGFIGSALIRQAIDKGHQIVNIDNLTYAANLANLSSVEGHRKYQFEQINICNHYDITRALEHHQPDTIMHLAAESHVDRSIDGPAQFIQTNIVGTSVMLECARQYFDNMPANRAGKFRFHHVSTDEVYGDLGRDDPAFKESTAYEPSSPYSASKASSDHLVRAWGRTYGLPILISNCSNNYGPFQFPEKLIPLVILKALHGQPIPVYGKGENIRDWLYVDDHAAALLAVLEKGKLGQTYNVGSNNERSNLEVVKTICGLIDARLVKNEPSESLIEFVPDRPGHDFRYAINASKIRDELGWAPKITWDEGFAKTIDWYLDNEDWWRPLVDTQAYDQRLGLKKSA